MIIQKMLYQETISPSMDISIASNFERLIYDYYMDRDADLCRKAYRNFPKSHTSR